MTDCHLLCLKFFLLTDEISLIVDKMKSKRFVLVNRKTENTKMKNILPGKWNNESYFLMVILKNFHI